MAPVSKEQAVKRARALMKAEGITAAAAARRVAKGASVSAETIRRSILEISYSKQEYRSTIARIEQLEQQVAELKQILRRMGATVTTATSSLTEDDVRAIRDRYARGEDTVALADAFGISHTAAANIVNGRAFRRLLDEPPEQAAERVGLRMGNRKLTAEQVQQIRNRHRSGETTTQLAKEHGVSWSTIDNIVNFRSWKVKPSGDLDGRRRRRKR